MTTIFEYREYNTDLDKKKKGTSPKFLIHVDTVLNMPTLSKNMRASANINSRAP